MTGIIALESGEFSVNELDGSIGITIKRTGDLSGPVTIEYGVNADTATESMDYLDQDGFVTMAAGQSEVTVNLTILDDEFAESTEVFNFSLVNVDSGTLQFPRTARINILDDENPVDDVAVPPLTSNYIVTTETVIDGLDRPISMEFVPGSDNLALVATKPGEIGVFNTDTGQLVDMFVNLRSQVNVAGDRGLLDIAIHPDFENNPYVYAMYVVDPPETAGASGNAARDGAGNRFAHVVRFEADMSNGYPELVPGSETVIVGGAATSLSDISGGGLVNSTSVESVDQRSSDVDPNTGEYMDDYIKVDSLSHAGGALEFGPDGALYIGVGDGTSFNFADPRTVAVQDVNSLSGKILRVDPITGEGFTDNPFYEAGMDLGSNAARVYQLGLRNPYTMAIEDDGTIFVSNTGWFAYEEIESGGAGANFGWPYYEGGDKGTLVKTPDYQYLPTAEAFYEAVESGEIVITSAFRAFSHADADPGFQFQAIVGASDVFTGDAYGGDFDNYYFFTDVSQGEVFAVDVNDRRVIEYLFTTETEFGPVHFKQGNDGYLYYADLITGEIGRYLIERDPSVGSGDPIYYDDIPGEAQFLTGNSSNDVFVIDADSTDINWNPAEDSIGTVVWTEDGYDVLHGFEGLRFNDRDVSLASEPTSVADGGTGGGDPTETLFTDTPGVTDHIDGTTELDVFVVDAPSTDFNWNPTDAGDGIVLWNSQGYDVLKGVEIIRFTNRDADIVNQQYSLATTDPGLQPVYHDDTPGVTDHVFGDERTDIFIIDGRSFDYNWGASESGTGIVIWNDDGYDVLKGVEQIQFSDRTVDLALEPTGEEQLVPIIHFDQPGVNQNLIGDSDLDKFAINGDSADFNWNPTEDGTGTVVYGETGFDVLTGFEALIFNDREVDLSTEPESDNGGETAIIGDVQNVTQHLVGNTANDVFVIDGDSDDYEWGPSESGERIVVWGDTGYDVLQDFETLQFNDRAFDLSNILQTGPDYVDIPDQIQHLKDAGGSANFIIDGLSSDYDWGLNQSGTGHVVWTRDIADTSFDVLSGFDTITFNDRTVPLDLDI